MTKHFGILILSLLMVLLFLFSGSEIVFSFFITIIGLYLAVKILGWLLGFLIDFVKTETVEVEKSSGTEPSGKTLEDLFEDSVETLLNLKKPKGNVSGRIADAAEEVLEKGSKLFK